MFEDQVEKDEGVHPVAGKVVVDDILEPQRIDALARQRIECRAELVGQPQRLDAADAGLPAPDQPRQQQAPANRVNRRQQAGFESGDHVESIIDIDVTERRHSRQQQTATGTAHERVGQRPNGTAAGQQDLRTRQDQRIAASAVDQPLGQCIGKRRFGRDCIDAGAGCRAQTVASSVSVAATAGGVPTSAHSPACVTPNRRSAAIALSHNSRKPKGPAGAPSNRWRATIITPV